jgi:hypothetical protein
MAVGWEEIVPRIVTEANMLPITKTAPVSEAAQDINSVRKN